MYYPSNFEGVTLAYGTKVVIPLEVGMLTIKIALVEAKGGDEALAISLDLAKERREKALVTIAAYQEQLQRSYNKKGHPLQIWYGWLGTKERGGEHQKAWRRETWP